MITTEKSGISLFVEQCLNNKLTHFICSPGSRNAPIVIALDEHPEIKTFIINDERSAGFYAIGMAQQLKSPVAVVCTSGSAMLNYYPAVAEAYYQCVPIVVISADRPKEWVNHGDGQTIVQNGVYKNHIRYEMEVPEKVNSINEIDCIKSKMNSAFHYCNTFWKGPIHFNIPISEPLYNTIEVDYFKSKLNFLKVHEGKIDLDLFSEQWVSSKKKMILCGQLDKNIPLQNLLSEIAKDTSIVVLVENTSNLVDSNFVQCIDRMLNSIDEGQIQFYQPDFLVTIGGAIVSKRIKKFLRKANIKFHWKIGFEFPEMNTYRHLYKSIRCLPYTFFSSIMHKNGLINNSTYGNVWKQNDYLIKDKLSDFYSKIEYSDLAVYEIILDYLPEDSIFHMGNSSVVRYCQLFDSIKSISYYSNRGTSGIDGSLSTACGASIIAKDKCNIVIIGDLSFFYDSNALWSRYLNQNLRIILINNGGGGIFKIIDGPSKTNQLDDFFVSKHQNKAKGICDAFDINYFQAYNIKEIENQMEEFYDLTDSNRPKLIEIFTPGNINHIVLRNFFETIK